jgi:hypothetical protein
MQIETSHQMDATARTYAEAVMVDDYWLGPSTRLGPAYTDAVTTESRGYGKDSLAHETDEGAIRRADTSEIYVMSLH